MKHLLLSTALVILFSQAVASQAVIFDASFGTAGKVTDASVTSGQTIQLQPDGKIISCYLADFSIAGNVRLTRYNTDGTTDTTFGTNGYVNSTVVNETGQKNMMKIQPDGKILITGSISSTATANTSYLDFCTVRFNSDGSLDTTFGDNGYAITGFQNLSYDEAQAIEIQNDGKIIVGGHSSQYYMSSPNYSPDFALVRYLPDGTLDPSFGTNGKLTYNFGLSAIPNTSGYSSDFLYAIEVNSQGKIIVGGETNVGETQEDYANFGFICLNADGTLDTTFGFNGQKVVDIGDKDYLGNLKLTPDDKIIATGRHQYTVGANTYNNIPLVKLLENGNFDTSFGNNGIALNNRDSVNLIDFCHDLNLQPDGKILCFGITPDPTATRANFLLIQFNANGTLDTTFNDTGYKTVDFDATNAYGSSFLIQPDGKFLCAGSINFTVGCLARLEIDTLATNSFATNTFLVYPNPFTEAITITNHDANFSNATIELFDVSGRKRFHYITEQSSQTIQMDKNLTKGNYLLKITSEGKKQTVMVIKK